MSTLTLTLRAPEPTVCAAWVRAYADAEGDDEVLLAYAALGLCLGVPLDAYHVNKRIELDDYGRDLTLMLAARCPAEDIGHACLDAMKLVSGAQDDDPAPSRDDRWTPNPDVPDPPSNATLDDLGLHQRALYGRGVSDPDVGAKWEARRQELLAELRAADIVEAPDTSAKVAAHAALARAYGAPDRNAEIAALRAEMAESLARLDALLGGGG